jgi:hypothetical protein
MSNPKGIGGFAAGRSGNPGGRLAAQSRMQLAFLQHADEIRRGMLAIWRNAEAPLHVRLQAGREILDRGLGKAQQSVALTAELGLNQNLDTASDEQLVQYAETYVAAITASPALIESMVGPQEPPPEFEFEFADAGNVSEGAEADGEVG